MFCGLGQFWGRKVLSTPTSFKGLRTCSTFLGVQPNQFATWNPKKNHFKTRQTNAILQHSSLGRSVRHFVSGDRKMDFQRKLPSFALERFFDKYEFSSKHQMGCSDCQSMTISDLLKMVAEKEGKTKQDVFEEMGEVWCGYTEARGTPQLREEIAREFYASDVIAKENILMHTGAEEAIFTTFSGLLSAGDQVIVQAPSYSSLSAIPKYLGAEVFEWETEWDSETSQWTMNFDSLDCLLKQTPNLKLLIINTPHNPTNYHFSREQIQTLIEIVKKRNAYFFCDEVYRFLEYPSPGEDSFLQYRLPGICEIYEKGISLCVLSKSFGLPGLRVGWIASQDKEVIESAAGIKDYTTICNPSPSEFLGLKAVGVAEKLVAGNREIVLENRKRFATFMESFGHLFTWQTTSNAGCLAFVGVKEPILSKFGSCEQFCVHLVQNSGVLLLPGSCFGPKYENYFRLGFGRQSFENDLRVLESCLKGMEF